MTRDRHTRATQDEPAFSKGFGPGRSPLTRRGALRALLGLAGAAAALGGPVEAFAAPSASQETLDKLSAAQAQYDEAQEQIDAIVSDYQELSQKQSKTLSQIEDAQTKIDAIQREIDEKQEDLKAKRAVLSERVAASYKTRGNEAIALLLSSSSFEELISNAYYVDTMNGRDHDAIAEVQKIQDELNEKKSELESEKSGLEVLRDQQTELLTKTQAKQEQVQAVLSGLSDDVKQLMEQRDAEILAAAQAEREAQEAAARQRKANGGRTLPFDGGSGQDANGLSAAQRRVLSACGITPCPGANLCAAWVSRVFQNAGIGYPGGNANDMYARYCTSSRKADLKVGMMIAVSTYSKNRAGSIWGHVGIYVGDNQVVESIGYINVRDLNGWISYYGDTVPVRWGWALGADLSSR